MKEFPEGIRRQGYEIKLPEDRKILAIDVLEDIEGRTWGFVAIDEQDVPWVLILKTGGWEKLEPFESHDTTDS